MRSKIALAIVTLALLALTQSASAYRPPQSGGQSGGSRSYRCCEEWVYRNRCVSWYAPTCLQAVRTSSGGVACAKFGPRRCRQWQRVRSHCRRWTSGHIRPCR